MRVCPDCGSEKIAHRMEGLMCQKCGLIIEEPITSGSALLL